MKNFTLLVFCVCFLGMTSLVNAQSLSLSGYISTSTEPTNLYSIDSHVTVTNQSGATVNVMIERTINYIVPGQDELFCFGVLCYAPGTAVSTAPAPLTAGSSIDFKATMNPNGNYGVSSMHYRLYSQDNPADSVGIDLVFAFGSATGINENKQDFGFSKPLRNPADAFTTFSYSLPSNEVGDKLVVYNMLGSFVKAVDVNGSKGNIILNTADLNPGVYLVSYVSGNKIKSTSKLVVRHN